jgi:Tfp pilus assembly protein PilF
MRFARKSLSADVTYTLGNANRTTIMISDGMKLIACCALVLLMTGCSTISLPQPRAYSADISELLSGRAMLGREVTEAELPNVDLFAITPEMAAFAKSAVRRGDSYFEKVKALHVALLTSAEAGGYGIVYSAYITEPPIITFQQRHANCLSFTLLYVALARSVGLNAKVNEVEIPPTWDMRNKKDMVFLRHVNVKVPLLGESTNILRRDDVVIDLEMDRYRSNYRQHEISDTLATAQFYSNRAMEYMDAGNFTDAFLSLRKSISLNNQQSYVWSNLGALYGRKKLLRESELAYLHALEVNPDDLTVMNNLSYHYNQAGNKEKALKFARLAQRYRESNPFYKYNLALSAFEQQEYEPALHLVLQAMDREKNDVRFYELAATLYEKLERPVKVLKMQKKIKKIKGE